MGEARRNIKTMSISSARNPSELTTKISLMDYGSLEK